MAREMSHHTPVVLDRWEHVVNRKFRFEFELSLLIKGDIKDGIRKIWEESAGSRIAIKEWNWRLENTRKQLKGWARNAHAPYRKEKRRLSDLLEYLDLKAEVNGLSFEVRDFLLATKKKFNELVKEDTIKFF
jgi:hypothetical protein